MRNPVAVDLFSGAGGLSEGLMQAGVDVRLAVELHPQPALTHAFNHPQTTVFVGDVRKLSDGLLRREAAILCPDGVDLVVGGPPCQGFSSAGKKLRDDPRNQLFEQFVHVVALLRPRMFLMENVPGFRTMYEGAVYSEAIKRFSGLGYSLQDTVLEAWRFGVPQRRQRFVLVGRLPEETESFAWPGELGSEACPHERFVSVGDAIEDIAFLEPGWEAHRHACSPMSQYQSERRNGELLFNHLASQHRDRAVTMFRHIPEGGTISQVPEELRSAKRTMARLDRNGLSNAVLALPDDLVHYRHDRTMTVREMARLQSFDDDYVFLGKRTSGFVERKVDVPQYTQVGNAVPPLLGRALGIALLQALGGRVGDVRNLEERRRRHSWICGTSGYAGYVLSAESADAIDIRDIEGRPLMLPLEEGELPVVDAPTMVRWKDLPRPTRRQWNPTVEMPRGTRRAASIG